jgi:diguanylate cyclase
MLGTYSPTLVTLSILTAMMASYIALDLAGRVTQSSGRAARLWLVGGAFAMGAGIWSMHFIGMLALSLPIRMLYDFELTIVSMLFAIAISGAALALVSGREFRTVHLAGGGIFMGAGISAMHYTGMAAMRMSPPIQYDPLLFAASVAIAVAAAMAALWLAFNLRSTETKNVVAGRVLAAMVMGLAIAGMHYTGMAAADFAPGSFCLAGGPLALGGDTLAFSIAAAIVAIFMVTLVGSLFDMRLARHTAALVRSLEASNRGLKAEISARALADAEVQKMSHVLRARSEELERSNRELEQFAFVASHDLQAPLRSVISFVQLLQRRLSAHFDNDANEYVQFITESVRHMQALIHALLELGRVGKSGLERGLVALDDVRRDAQHQLESLIRERGAVIEADTLPTLLADRVLLVQVLQNLIGNAIKFQPDRTPHVRITARRSTDEWIIGVTDRGIGIERQHFERIFQIFQRLHSSASYEGNGVGPRCARRSSTCTAGGSGSTRRRAQDRRSISRFRTGRRRARCGRRSSTYPRRLR